MRDQGGDGGVPPAPPTVPPRGASRAVLLEQRKKEAQDAAVVGALVKVVYAEAWTTRAGAAMSSGYGRHVLKKKLCHVGDGDKSDGFDPSACQTYRDIDQFLAEPDERSSLTQSRLVLSPVWCHTGLPRKDLQNSKTSGLIFSMIIPQSKSLVVGIIRWQVTVCCGREAHLKWARGGQLQNTHNPPQNTTTRRP